jgi:hypothetical protein
VVRGAPPEAAEQFEETIGADIAELSREVAEAATALSEAKGDPREAALERTRDLVRRMESIHERVKAGPPGAQEGEGREGRGAEQQGEGDSRTASGEPGGGETAGSGAVGSPGGGGGPVAGVWGQDRVRQMRRELRERAVEAQGIGSQLAGHGGVPADLRAIERKLRQLQRQETWGDPLGVETLVAETLEDLKMFEYALRRELEGTDVEKLRLSGSAEVPEGWRRLVEEYYRSLAREGS